MDAERQAAVARQAQTAAARNHGEQGVAKQEEEEEEYTYSYEESEEVVRQASPEQAKEAAEKADKKGVTQSRSVQEVNKAAQARVAELKDALNDKKLEKATLYAQLEAAQLEEALAEVEEDIAKGKKQVDLYRRTRSPPRARSPGQGAPKRPPKRARSPVQRAKKTGKEPSSRHKKGKEPKAKRKKPRARSPGQGSAASDRTETPGQGARRRQDLKEAEAEQWAKELEADFSKKSPRPSEGARRPTPPWAKKESGRKACKWCAKGVCWTHKGDRQQKRLSRLEKGEIVQCDDCISDDPSCWTYTAKLHRPGHKKCRRCKKPYVDGSK